MENKEQYTPDEVVEIARTFRYYMFSIRELNQCPEWHDIDRACCAYYAIDWARKIPENVRKNFGINLDELIEIAKKGKCI